MKGRSLVQDLSMIEIEGLNAPVMANQSQIVKLSLRTRCSWSKCEWGLSMGWFEIDFWEFNCKNWLKSYSYLMLWTQYPNITMIQKR